MVGMTDLPIEIETGASPDATVIWLHGLGADGHDFVPIVPELRLPTAARIRFIFPHAPEQPVTLNGGYVMRAWYDIYGISAEAPQDTAGIAATEQTLRALIERERARGVAYQRIVLAGFSQGGSMALHAGLRFPQRLGGLLALSTWLPLSDQAGDARSRVSVGLPVFMAHGREDPIVPLAFAERSRALLDTFALNVEWHVYTMGHTVVPDEIADIGRWLSSRFV